MIIKLRNENKTWREVGEIMSVDGENVRGYARKQSWYSKIRRQNANGSTEEIDRKTYDSNGNVTSSIKKRLKERKVFTNEELLEIHGLNAEEVQIRTITSNEWSVTNAEGEQYYNFQSKIVAEPIVKEITLDYIKGLLTDIQPRKVELEVEDILNTYLLIPFADMHWGLNYAKDYETLKAKIADRLLEGHREVVFALLGDFMHVDNLLNTTVRGTRVDDVDVEQATKDAYQFMIDMLDLALKQSPCVKLVYLQGNHDSMSGYMFTQGIKRLYPDVEVDDSIETLKHTWIGEHSLFFHHGDKITERRLLEAVVGKFPKEWGEGKQRYLITGHRHHEKSVDIAGVTHYQVSTPSKATKFEDDYGYNGTEQVQMLFRFDDDKRDAIYYL